MKLRPYQQNAIDLLYKWLRENEGNPCLVLPTGAGKSIIIAELCRNALTEWPETTILMLTRSKELIEQNAAKLRQLWPNAPMGVYSASVGKRQLGEPITIAGTLSVASKIKDLGHIDIILCDECHDISHQEQGTYRKIIAGLKEANPALRVVGLTASPYRMGHGLITDKPAIFDGLIEPVGILELMEQGFLAPLRSKHTSAQLSTDGVHKRGGEFIEAELQAAVNTPEQNAVIVDEAIARAADRKSWMFFCAGVDHARAMRDVLIERGIEAVSVTGDMPKAEREAAVRDFKAGKIRALTNVNCLSTGFDHPDLDLLVMARPTMSPGLYMQQAGRGLRPKSHGGDCMVLDFAGNVSRHGPIIDVQPPRKPKKGEPREAPPVTKECEQCFEIVGAATKKCPACGFVFEVQAPKEVKLHHDDIMGGAGAEMAVTEWSWRKHTSRASGKAMLAVSYYGGLLDPTVTEYLPVLHDGYAATKAIVQLHKLEHQAGAALPAQALELDTLADYAAAMNKGAPPAVIEYRKDGQFFRVMNRSWTQ